MLKYTLYIHVIVLQLYAQKIKCSLTYIISASIKAVVDGAVNELHKYNQTIESKDMLIPDLISGDFDSINPDLLQHYREKVIKLGKIIYIYCVFSETVSDLTNCIAVFEYITHYFATHLLSPKIAHSGSNLTFRTLKLYQHLIRIRRTSRNACGLWYKR